MTIECPKCQYNNPNDTAFCGKCGTNFNIDKGPTKTLETHSEELTTGSTFAGRYQIIEELGKGGMGRVYKVLDKETNEKIALKLIKPEVATDKKTIERFRNELTTARKIAQKNVCRMFDLNREKDNYFITMEYVPGGDLKKFIRRSKQLTIGTAISIAKQICDGLAEAHNLGVVHRDLKPNNIMIDDNGNARIMDFGIARSVKSKSLTGSGVMIGTPEYMSPEQVEGKEVDQRTDIYALGIILYEMLTGRRPFEGDSPITIGVKHKSEQPENPHKYNPQITDNLSFLILKCLEKSKENRFQFVEEITSELTKLESALPIADKLIPKKSITSKEITVSLPSKRTIIPIAIAVTVLILAVLIFNPFSKKKTVMPSSNKPSIAVLYFENTNDDENLKGYRTMLSNMMITDLSQSKYLNILTIDKTYSLLRKLGIEESKRYSTEDLIKVSREGQVDYVVTGSYIQGIEDFTITLVMQKLDSGKPILNERVSCQGEDDIWPKIDEI